MMRPIANLPIISAQEPRGPQDCNPPPCCIVLLPPDLADALTGLAKMEGHSLMGLILRLINEAFDQRLAGRR